MCNVTSPRAFMVRMGLIYPRAAYSLVRTNVQRATGLSLRRYFEVHDKDRIYSEFEGLGLALWLFGHNLVEWDDLDIATTWFPVSQAWSWGGLSHQRIAYNECILRTVPTGPVVGPISNATKLQLKALEQAGNALCGALLSPTAGQDFNRKGP